MCLSRVLLLRNDLTAQKKKKDGGAYLHISNYVFVDTGMDKLRYSVAVLLALIDMFLWFGLL